MNLRQLKSNIWHGVLSATQQEIRDGVDFYHGAHGLCRMFSLLDCARQHSLTPSHIAGIYAALSPLNGWYSNVSNILSVLRHRWDSRVNTTLPNHWKALAISYGADPLDVLRGRKVRSFYRGIANPDDLTPIPVDRHLINLALGTKITDNQELRSYASDKSSIANIESAYRELGERESLGNRLASIAWFVQRRVSLGQIPILQPSLIVCCNRPMIYESARKRFSCKLCRKSITRKRLTYNTPARAKSIPIGYHDGYPIYLTHDPKDIRKRLYLGRSHPLADKNGYCYLSRYIVSQALGRKLRSDEHVDHKNTNKLDDRLDNYRLMLAEQHGKHHYYIAELAGNRGANGRFIEYKQPMEV